MNTITAISIILLLLIIIILIVLRKRYTREGFDVRMKRMSYDPNLSFMSNINYTGQEYLSDSNWLEKCRTKCKNDQKCYGFFEQTHLCPQHDANDNVSNPNETPGKGCVRICGFFNNKPNNKSKLINGPPGSVWIKKKND